MSLPPKTPPPARRRVWRRIVWGGLGVLFLALVTCPLWLPWLVVHGARTQGVSIGAWDSHGWRTVEYRNVSLVRDGIRVAVDVVELPRFLVWPRHRPQPGGARAAVHVEGARVELLPRPVPADRPSPSVARTVRDIQDAWDLAERWLPSARIEDLVVVAGDLRVEVDAATWDGQTLQADVAVPARDVRANVRVEAQDNRRFALALEEISRGVRANATVAPGDDSGIHLAGTIAWREVAMELVADFGAEGILPRTASVRAPDFAVPSGALGLEGYGPVAGALDLAWTGAAFTLRLDAEADPEAPGEWPPLAVEVRASGNTERVRLDAVNIQTPVVEASLSQPLEIDLAARMPADPAEFSLVVNLDELPRIQARGTLAGSAVVRPLDDGTAEVQFTVAGEGLGWREIEGGRLSVAGQWRPDELVIGRASVEVGTDAVSEGSLQLDLRDRIVRAASVRAVVPQAILRAIAADFPACERIEVTAEASGPWKALQHAGTLSFTGFEWTRERRISGSSTWTGQGMGGDLEGELALAGGGTLPFAASVERTPEANLRGELTRMSWVDAEGEWWRLEAPVAVSFVPENGELQVAPWRIFGDGFELAGEARVRWPAVGTVSLVAIGVEGYRFGGVLPEAVRGGRLERMNVQARWDNGPLMVDGSFRAIYLPVKDTAFAVEGDFVSREGGLAFGSIQVQGTSGVVLRGAGRVPLLMEGDDRGFRVELLREAPIALELASEPNPVFWESIADLTGWSVEDPRVACRLHGSIAKPRGELDFAAGRVRPPETMLKTGGRLPELTGTVLRLVADDAGVSIVEGVVAVDDRWVTLVGRAPWDVWTHWQQTRQIGWRRAEFELASNPLPIAIASEVFPTELAPEGEVSIRIGHEPAEGLSGHIWLHNAASRPIGPLGSVREVKGELGFSGYAVELTRLEGLLGGQPLRITGRANLEDSRQAEFALHVRSSRVPLVRRAGLIVRTELDLQVTQDRNTPARVTGRVDFGPSIYSTDLLELIPTGSVDRPEKRPPYFSVENKPFAEWQLDVAVHGDAFLRLTTPFYKDILSADAKLKGTLAEPRLEGWVWGTGGVVSFPFGSIPVEQVLVTLSRENPYEPQISVSGAARVLGFDIRMEATGPASEPRLLFTSDPPLTSQQVFMMLTTGAVPSESHTIGTSDRASRLALFLGRNLAAGLGLGGEYGGDERLDIRSGEDFTRAGRETIVVQYDLDKRWSIVGEYDRFDAYNGGIKFRIIDR